jgi:cell division protein FtsI/penicillin-binding protein 2
MNSNSVIRIRILLVCVCIWAFILTAKLYHIQIVRGEEYTELGDAQYIKPESTAFERGSIYFESKNGTKVSTATIKEGYTIAIHPSLIYDPQMVYDAVSQYVPLDHTTFMQKATKPNDQYEELFRRFDRQIGVAVGELGLMGVSVIPENWRVYPGGELAAHTIGLVGFDEKNEVTGRYGLERFYENTLTSKNNGRHANFFAELFADISGGITTPASDRQNREGDIVAAIDPTVQDELEKILKSIQATWNSDSIGGIIMNPKTGLIYGMAARPTYDPNNLKEVTDPRVFSNPLVENVYEMGSIIKPLTMAAGLDSGAIKPETTYNDTGFLELNGKKISNYDGKARGVVPMQEVLSQSLNVGAATIALKMSMEDFRKYFLSFGLGDLTGIDQPNEQKGIVDNLKTGREIERATASYGQGIAFSPIATVRGLSILANTGVLVQPHIVKEINYKDGGSIKISPKNPVRVIQKDTAEEVTKMLVSVVDKNISKAHPAIKMERYSIAAKTGTAQIADHDNGGYYTDRYLHSFFGYFPAYSPRFIVFLYQVYPKGAQYASETLTDPFAELAKFLINYYEIPPDR